MTPHTSAGRLSGVVSWNVANEPPFEIRRAKKTDLETIVAMLAKDSLAAKPPATRPTSRQTAAFLWIEGDPDNELVVATIAGEIVVTLQLTFIPGLSYDGAWRAQVEGVRVREDLRSQGIGTRLMEWVMARARERECALIQLTSNAARVGARRFYERLGFVASHTGMKLPLR